MMDHLKLRLQQRNKLMSGKGGKDAPMPAEAPAGPTNPLSVVCV